MILVRETLSKYIMFLYLHEKPKIKNEQDEANCYTPAAINLDSFFKSFLFTGHLLTPLIEMENPLHLQTCTGQISA